MCEENGCNQRRRGGDEGLVLGRGRAGWLGHHTQRDLDGAAWAMPEHRTTAAI